MITSMSKLERDVNCDGSLVFPQSPRSTAAAGHGNVVHDFLMRVPRVGRELALAQTADDRHRAALEKMSLEGLPLDPAAYAQEVAIAYDTETDTARELCRGRGRPDYSQFGIKPSEAVCTIDVLGVTESAVVVIDYKSGFMDLGPVKDNWQLRGCALAAARLFGREEAIISIIRLKPVGDDHFVDRAPLSAMALDVVQQALCDVRTRKERFKAMFDAGKPVPTHQGPWCTYCPSFDFCPPKMSLIRSGLTLGKAYAEDKTVPFFPAALTPESAPEAYRNRELLRGVLKRYDELFDEYASRHPVELGNGYVYGPRQLTQESIDVDRAGDILRRWLGDEVEDAIEVKRSLSKDAAQELLSRRFRGKKDPVTGARVKLSDVFEAFFESLREADAVRVRTTHPVMRYKRAAELPSGGEHAT